MKLSVTVMTFNHFDYLEQCLDSIVNQQVDFEYEIIVADDCSTDGNREVIKRYREMYPDLIKPIYQDKNTYTVDKKNYKDAYDTAQGMYIAYIDGDDIMAPGKLQSQVDYLDQNLDCWMVHHPLIKINKEGKEKSFKKVTGCPPKDKVELKEYLFPGFTIKHSSKMFRRDAIPDTGFCYDIDKMSLDVVWIVQSFLHTGLKAGFISKPLGYYRQFAGVSQNLSYIFKRKKGVSHALDLVEKSRPDLAETVKKAKIKQEILQAAETGDWRKVRSLSRDIKAYKKLHLLSHFPFIAKPIFRVKKKHFG